MSHYHERVPLKASIIAERPVFTGIALGVGSLGPHLFLEDDLSVAFAAVLISLIAGIYFGFAVVNGSTREQVIEFSVANGFLFAAVLGIALWPGIIAVAYIGHAAWDFAHHNGIRLPLVRVPGWYVPWCAAVDGVIGLGLIVMWRVHGLI
jgi:hypothetical protein